MPQIELNGFSLPSARRQAAELASLTTRNENWLNDSYYAGALARYGRGQLRGVRNITRIAMSDTVYPFVLSVTESDNATRHAVGIATIIRRQAIEHPGLGYIVRGADLDYWLDE